MLGQLCPAYVAKEPSLLDDVTLAAVRATAEYADIREALVMFQPDPIQHTLNYFPPRRLGSPVRHPNGFHLQ